MSNLSLNINSIYFATEGEGIMLGTPQVFIRFQGCSIGCVNCDSLDTWDFTQMHSYSVDSVYCEVEKLLINCQQKRISITGGDPLHPSNSDGVLALVKEFKGRGYFINIEAAGTRIVDSIFDLVDFISIDYKSPSTGVKTQLSLLKRLNLQFAGKFQVKTVVQDKKDFDYVLKAYEEFSELEENMNFSWCLTPSYLPLEDETFIKRFREIIHWNMNRGGHFRVIGQQHKWMYGPSLDNV